MKKIIIIFMLLLTITFSTTPINAMDNAHNVGDINMMLQSINEAYDTNFHVYEEYEYYENNLDKTFNMDYQSYLSSLLTIDITSIYDECIDLVVMNTCNEINIDEVLSRSTSASKTSAFNSGRNKMTLKYKYITKNSVKYFDTSYKPTVSVTKVATIDYFEMSSYTGSFKNSNKTYSVSAKGNIITYVGKTNKTFTVNFNLN